MKTPGVIKLERVYPHPPSAVLMPMLRMHKRREHRADCLASLRASPTLDSRRFSQGIGPPVGLRPMQGHRAADRAERLPFGLVEPL